MGCVGSKPLAVPLPGAKAAAQPAETVDINADASILNPVPEEPAEETEVDGKPARSAPTTLFVQAKPQKQKDIIYVGVDFGTSRSGYAFANGSDSAPQLQFSWPGESVQAAKTLTSLLYDKSTWEPISWGMEAYSKFISMRPSEQEKYLYLEGFKLLLSESAGGTVSSAVTTLPKGCPHKPDDIIGHYLAFLGRHLQAQLRQSFNQELLDKAEVKYCMTIPAGWSDSAKSMTRRAAAKSGMVKDQAASNNGELTLLYEPEAAALTACQQASLTVEVGQKFLILDAGGGTVDFTMHIVEQRAAGHKVLSEATYRACLLQGSKKVDSAFQDWLTEFVGRRDFEEWRTSTSKDYLSLMAQWEAAKRAFNGDTPEGSTILRLPFSLVKVQLTSGKSEHHQLVVTDDIMKRFFDSAIEPMIQTVRDVVERAGARPNRLLLVGGFGSSAYLRHKLQSVFGTSMGELLSPPFAYSAVVEGAVRFLQSPATIVARVSSLTYCVQVTAPWDRATMPEHIREKRDKRWMTTKGLVLAVNRGQRLRVRDTFKYTVIPVVRTSGSVWIKVFSTPEANPKYITDDMELAALIEVPVDQSLTTGKHDKYRIQLTFRFGAAEMIVEAHDQQQDTKVQVHVNFASQAIGSGAALEAQKMGIRV